MAAEDYIDKDYIPEDDPQNCDNLRESKFNRKENKMTKKLKLPLLIKVGNHLIDPNDVSCITRIKDRNLYVVRLKSQPNMEYPIWVKKNEIAALTTHFEIIIDDSVEEKND